MQPWLDASWTEVGEADGPYNPYPYNARVYLANYTGDIRLVISQKSSSEPWQVENGLWRRADLSAATTAEVSFAYRRSSLEAGDYLAVEASVDGGATWAEAGRVPSATYDLTWQFASFDLTPFIAENFALRLVSHYVQDPGYDAWDTYYLDNITITHNGGDSPADGHPTLVDADDLHLRGINGSGVTVAVLDTGIWAHRNIAADAGYYDRVRVQYDAISDQIVSDLGDYAVSDDQSGHGSHMASILVNSDRNDSMVYNGIAPEARPRVDQGL